MNWMISIIIIIIIIIIISLPLVTCLISPVLLFLNQRRSPPLRLQVSDCITHRIMCDVPCLAAFCSESIECFPGVASKFFFKPFVNIPVASVIFGLIIHSIFHIRCVCIHKLLYFSFFFLLPFAWNFSPQALPLSIRMHVYYYYFYYYFYYYYYLYPVVRMSLLKNTASCFKRRDASAFLWASGFELSVPFIFCFSHIRTTHCPRFSLLIVGSVVFDTYYRRPWFIRHVLRFRTSTIANRPNRTFTDVLSKSN